MCVIQIKWEKTPHFPISSSFYYIVRSGSYWPLLLSIRILFLGGFYLLETPTLGGLGSKIEVLLLD